MRERGGDGQSTSSYSRANEEKGVQGVVALARASPLVGAQFFAGREEHDAGVGAVDAVEDLLHRELTATRVGHNGGRIGWRGDERRVRGYASSHGRASCAASSQFTIPTSRPLTLSLSPHSYLVVFESVGRLAGAAEKWGR